MTNTSHRAQRTHRFNCCAIWLTQRREDAKITCGNGVFYP